MTTAPACIETLRARPSRARAWFISSRICGVLSEYSFNSLASPNAFSRVMPGLVGTSLASLSTTGSGTSRTLPASRMAALAPSVPMAITFATLSAPYFSTVYSRTFCLPTGVKSISISGMEDRSGFKNRSKSSLYLNGSIRVIPVR